MGSKKGLDLIKIVMERFKGSKAFDRVFEKVSIVSAGDGKCTAEFKVEEEHQNMGGTLHGGFSATLVDGISTLALMTYGRQVPGVSVDMHISYLKAAFEGEEVVVDARTIKAGKTLAFLDVTIKNKATGHILVTGTHTKFIGSN